MRLASREKKESGLFSGHIFVKYPERLPPAPPTRSIHSCPLGPVLPLQLECPTGEAPPLLVGHKFRPRATRSCALLCFAESTRCMVIRAGPRSPPFSIGLRRLPRLDFRISPGRRFTRGGYHFRDNSFMRGSVVRDEC